MSFAAYFRASSYAMIAVAMLALALAGGLSLPLVVTMAVVMTVAWKLEGTRWQLSERAGLVLVLLSLPLFYLDWKYLGPQLDGNPVSGPLNSERVGVSTLGHLIVFLSAIKLLQVKSDRDWVFLYLISFFEVLLAAGLSFGPIFLGSLSLYLVCAISTIIAFEIQKAKRRLSSVETRLLVAPDAKIFTRLARQRAGRKNVEVGRLPVIAFVLLILIFVLALPLFLVAPRAGSAAFTRGGGLTNFIGFSESVNLGDIGTLKQNNQVVMHVRIEQGSAEPVRGLKWRGVALDEFTGRGWRKSAEGHRSRQETNDRGFYQLGTTEALPGLTTQTFFMEPLDTPVIFAAPRVIALQGTFPYLRIDAEGTIQSRKHEFDRVIYKAISDTKEPEAGILRRDLRPYPASVERYKQLPDSLDPRISDLARGIVLNAQARNRYDAAKAIESQLQSYYRYSLELKASGPDPLADFLFNVGAGHCEYFSTAMAVMLRTRGIAARVVNGFLPGEYNDAANAYTVRQSDAHSWVEVYFPETNSWVTFDPTPAAGRAAPVRGGLAGWFGKYAEALELLWFQYVVGYDKQEQRSLASNLNNRLFELRRVVVAAVAALKQAGVRVKSSYLLLGAAVVVLLIPLARRVSKLGWRRALKFGRDAEPSRSAVEFYERLMNLLAERDLKRAPHQTPLEFAAATGFSEALTVTSAYHRVRYGAEQLSAAEARRIEELLSALEHRVQSASV